MKTRTCCVVFFLVFSTHIIFSQVATGAPPFNSFGGGPFDLLNLGNLNVHFSIPIINKPGRGIPFAYSLGYDSSIWTPTTSSGTTSWSPNSTWGWQSQTDGATGYLVVTSWTGTSTFCTINGVRVHELLSSWTWSGFVDRLGTFHHVPGLSFTQYCNTNVGTSGTADDGSGYVVAVGQTAPPQVTVTARNGATWNMSATLRNAASSGTDANGNQVTTQVSGSITNFFDTLSSTSAVLSVSGTAPNPVKYTYASPNNPSAYAEISYKSYTVQTDFQCPNITEYGPTSASLVDRVTLADGSYYQFAYEQTPIAGSTNVTGRLASVTLPTGGTIAYSYTGVNDGINCADGSTIGLTRTLSPGGQWQYARTQQTDSKTHWQTKVTTPPDSQNQGSVGDDTAIDFQEDSAQVTPPSNYFFETQRQVYQGSAASGTLLATLTTCYNGHFASQFVTCVRVQVSSPIAQLDLYTQPAGGATRLSEIVFGGYGLVVDDKEYDYGVTMVGAPGTGHLIREKATTYGSYNGSGCTAMTNGVVDRPCQVTVYDWSTGSEVALASSTYTYDGSTPTQTSGTPQHISVTGSRGNLTTSATQTTSTTTLYRQVTYYDTGMPNNSTDSSTSSTTTCANSPSTCTTYAYSSTNNASCGNSFPTSISEPMNLSVSMTWNCAGGVLTQMKDPNGNPTSYTFGDANFWLVTKTSFPDGGSTSTTYNFGTNSPWNIQTTTAKDNSTNVTSEMVLDGFGRVLRAEATSDPSNNIDYVDTVYDSLGRVASVSNPYQTIADPTYGITQYAYDALNRATSVKHPDSTQARFSYAGRATQVVDEGNNSSGANVQKVYQTDGLGRLSSVCEVSAATQLGSSGTPVTCGQDIAATGFLTSYGYDALGNLKSVAQGSLANRTYSYDYLSRLTQEVNPESGTTTYTYDTGTPGDLYQRTRPKPNQTGSATVAATYTFDKLHRMTGVSYNDGSTSSVTLNYDQSSVSGETLTNYLGHLTSANAANGTTGAIFSYDPIGRVAENWQCTPLNCGSGTFSLNFAYDYLGDVTSLANSKEGVTYTYKYDTLTRLTRLQSSLNDSNHPGTLLTVNTYNPLGEITKATLGNGIIRNVAYDNRGRPTSLSDASVYSFTLGYAGDNNVLTGDDSINGSWRYTYDDFNRVTSANKNNGQQTYSYDYDRYSNRWQQNSNPSYIFNSNNQIQGSGVVYDSAGNITNDGLGNLYTYDAENRVISVTGSNSVTYVYDAFGQRVRATINSAPYDFIYNNGGAVDEVTGSGWQWGDAGALRVALYANSTTYFDHTDWIGSVRAWSNPSGNSVGTCANLPFGDSQNCTGTSPNSWHYTGFTGLPSDSESGLTHALFRQLSTTQGRWTTVDPGGLAAVDPGNPQTWNRYAYVGNNPLSYVDPLGLTTTCDYNSYTILSGGWVNGQWMPVYIVEVNLYCSDTGGSGGGASGTSGSGGGGGGGAGGGAGNSSITQRICKKLPSGRTTGVVGGIGGTVAPQAGGELVVNYDSGQVSAFGFNGVQVGWNGGASASVYTGFVWGLNSSNSNYAGGFTGANLGAGVGGFVAASSQGMDGSGLNGIVPNPRDVTAGGVSFGASLIPGITGGVTLTNYSNPAQLGKYWGFGLNELDWILFAARQICK